MPWFGVMSGRRNSVSWAVAVLASLVVATPQPQETPGDAPPLPEPIPPSPAESPEHFRLLLDMDRLPIVGWLDQVLPRADVDDVLDDANRTATSGRQCDTDAFLLQKLPAERFCFELSDTVSAEWVPQGVTTVSDAQADGSWDGNDDVVLISWYDRSNPGRGDRSDPRHDPVPGCEDDADAACPEKGVRVTFLDTDSQRYRHVLLVWPSVDAEGHPSFGAVHGADDDARTAEHDATHGIHAGGIAWYGNYLYVADTGWGLRVFDMRAIFDLAAGGEGDPEDSAKRVLGRNGDTYSAYGYRYVMPQVHAWRNADGETTEELRCRDEGPVFSYLSIERGGPEEGDALIAGEYCPGGGPSNGRVSRWPLNPATGMLAFTADREDRIAATPTDVWPLPAPRIQGAARIAGSWYFSQSNGCWPGRQLSAEESARGLTVTSSRLTAVGAEDLSHWRDRQATYSVSEHTSRDCPGRGGRVVYGSPVPDSSARRR